MATPLRTVIVSLVGVVAGAVTLGACSDTPSASPATTTSAAPRTPSSSTTVVAPTSSPATSAGPPCTETGISGAVMKATSVGPVIAVHGYACSGSWAYANVEVGTAAANSYDAVIVLQADVSGWAVADRATACSNHLVPSAIYTPACTTS